MRLVFAGRSSWAHAGVAKTRTTTAAKKKPDTLRINKHLQGNDGNDGNDENDENDGNDGNDGATYHRPTLPLTDCINFAGS